MTDTENQLLHRIAELEARLTQELKLSASLKEENQRLLEQFRLAQQKQFGASSEAHPGQGQLFNETEEVAEQAQIEAEEEKQTISYERKKPTRKPLPKDLPREVVVHDIADEDKICDCCGHELHKMGEDKSEKLEFVPAKIKVIEHIRPKYSCRHCEQTNITSNIKQAPVPTSVIPKGIATASLLSQIITSKYQYGLPLYRQESLFKQYGIELSRKTMADWMIKSAALLAILYDLLREILLKQAVIQADETTLKVLNEDKSTCYMWLYCTGTDSPNTNSTLPNIVLYDYQRSRSGSCAVEFLGGENPAYKGYLQVDGYAGYGKTKAILVGCFAHARRKFKEAKQAQPKGKSGKADMALNQIQKLYRIETQIKGKTSEEKYITRQQKSLPLLKKLKEWLDKSAEQVTPQSKLGEAITYCLNQWHKLIRYTEDGRLNIDNNRSERAIKPFVIGRKNWLFSKSASGARASANLYSIIETAKANNLIPFDYLHHLLNELPKRKTDDDMTDLLPWNVSLTEPK